MNELERASQLYDAAVDKAELLAEDLGEQLTENAVRRAVGVADDLRVMADNIERRLLRGPSRDIQTLNVDHMSVATHILHTVMWGLANLQLDEMTAAFASAQTRGTK